MPAWCLAVVVFLLLFLLVPCSDSSADVPHMSVAKVLTPLRRTNTSKCIFIKTHRTAGSVISSILRNVAVSKNRSVLLPPAGEATSPLWRMERKQVQRVLRAFSNSSSCVAQQYDIWAGNCTFDPFLFTLVRGTGKQLLSIVRHPAHRLVSAMLDIDKSLTVSPF